MTVGELREILGEYEDNTEVLMKPDNGIYAYGINGVSRKELRAFFGGNREILTITSSGQEGAV